MAGTFRGFVNAHTHLYSGLAPLGMPAPEPAPANFVEILQRVWWKLDRALDEPTLRASARFYVAEALLAGTTTLVDHHESPEFIEGSLEPLADACQELGMRALLCYGATERNDGRREAQRGLAECRRFARDNTRPQVKGAVGLHASFTVSDDTIAEAGELCRELGTVLHVHVAEDGADVDDACQRGYEGPLERLEKLGALPSGSILAHGVHLRREQLARAGALGCWLVQNPRSNEGNRVGYPLHLAAARQVALGTDGYPANMPEEMEALRRLAKEHGDREVDPKQRLNAGAELVAQRFGANIDQQDHVLMVDGSAVEVVVAGRRAVENGRLVNADIEEIRGEAQKAAPGLWARMGSD